MPRCVPRASHWSRSHFARAAMTTRSDRCTDRRRRHGCTHRLDDRCAVRADEAVGDRPVHRCGMHADHRGHPRVRAAVSAVLRRRDKAPVALPAARHDDRHVEHEPLEVPGGTKLWKEFTRGTTRVETRFITKLLADDAAPGAWFYASFEWNSTQTDTTLASPGAGVPDANGTQHDIPSRANCRRCHEGVPGRVLGFQAISLDYAARRATSISPTRSHEPAVPRRRPRPRPARTSRSLWRRQRSTRRRSAISMRTAAVPQPGVARVRAHAARPAARCHQARHGAGRAGLRDDRRHQRQRRGLLGKIVDTQITDDSVMLIRMNAPAFPPKMPEIGTEIVDPDGQLTLRAWIDSL